MFGWVGGLWFGFFAFLTVQRTFVSCALGGTGGPGFPVCSAFGALEGVSSCFGRSLHCLHLGVP